VKAQKHFMRRPFVVSALKYSQFAQVLPLS
jgi:hypothetical protein